MLHITYSDYLQRVRRVNSQRLSLGSARYWPGNAEQLINLPGLGFLDYKNDSKKTDIKVLKLRFNKIIEVIKGFNMCLGCSKNELSLLFFKKSQNVEGRKLLGLKSISSWHSERNDKKELDI